MGNTFDYTKSVETSSTLATRPYLLSINMHRIPLEVNCLPFKPETKQRLRSVTVDDVSTEREMGVSIRSEPFRRSNGTVWNSENSR
ncbi:hypothetical protein CEXT_447681 [Caerostris extrusa]|uniref:Uncharacterized protein n=1 Tax=Caerostris extrusa TaxID=172846 RepID=A0AAV4US82_CAEEX|nr:hypothetical protein CEXT_447681 [Caerostris extrusa]